MKKLSKNGITTLKKQYKSVLIKCLAINTGVFVLASPAMAINGHNYGNTDLIISTETYPNGATNPTQGGVHEYDEEEHQDAYNYKSITIDNGKLTIENNFKLRSGSSVVLNGGEITVSDGSLKAQGNYFEVKGGKLTVTGSGQHNVELNSQGIKISGGEVNLTGDLDFTNDNTEKEFSISAGKVIMNGGSVAIGSNQDCKGLECTAGKFEMTGGELIVNNGSAKGGSDFSSNYLEGSEININDAVLTINKNAYLETVAGMKIDETGEPVELHQGTINLKNKGLINLGGTLYANIDGNYRGLIVFENSNAVIDGNVESPSITFNASHSLSKAITGSIGDLEKLAITKGIFSFDKEPAGTITTVEVADGATLDIGLNILRSEGGYKEYGEGVYFKDNSTLKFTATSADTHGQIKANYFNISENGTMLNMTLNGAAIEKDSSITIQLFDQSEDEEGVEIEGKFANLASNTRYKFTDEGNGYYKVSNIASASDIVEEAGGDANNAATAEAWDNLDTSSTSNVEAIAVANKLAELSNNATTDEGKKAYVDALTALAPETAPAATQTATDTAGAVFNAVGSRLSGGSVAGNQGMSSGDALNGVALWIQGMFNHAKFDGNKHSKGFDSDTWGTALGVEKQFNSSVKAGVGYAYSKTDIDGFMRDTDVKTHTAILYGEYKPSNWYANAVVSYGWSDYDEKKNVAGVNVKSKYDLEAFALQAMTGYDIYSTFAKITPEVGLRYIHVEQDDYTDTSGQHVKSNDSDIVTGVMGAKIAKSYNLSNGMLLTPEFKAAMTYDISHDNSKSTITLINGSSYSVSGKPLNRFGVEVGTGVTAELNDSVELFLGYEGKFRKDYQDHTGMINAKYKF